MPEWALAYRFDIVLRGRNADADGALIMSGITPSQTVGPWFAYGLTPHGQYEWSDIATGNLITPDVVGDRIRIEGIVRDGDGAPIQTP